MQKKLGLPIPNKNRNQERIEDREWKRLNPEAGTGTEAGNRNWGLRDRSRDHRAFAKDELGRTIRVPKEEEQPIIGRRKATERVGRNRYGTAVSAVETFFGQKAETKAKIQDRGQSRMVMDQEGNVSWTR